MANFALLFGPLLLLSGIANYFLTPFFTKLISSRILVIQEGTIYYDKWIKTPVPFNVSLYLFNVKNPKEVMAGKTPRVEEIGPFVFSQTREKKILGYSPDKFTVKYMETKDFEFRRELSVAGLDQYYVTPNIAFLSTVKIYNNYLKTVPLSFLLQPVATGFLSTMMDYYQQNLFINVTVNDMMFKGVHLNFVPFLQTLRSFAQNFERFGVGTELTALSNNSFSFFKYVNHTSNGPYEVYTGLNDISKLSQLKKYKDKEILDIWSDSECNVVRGSDGIQFSPLKKDKSRLHVFTHELCRSVTLEYKRDTSVRGIKTLRYEPTDDVFMKDSNGKCSCTLSQRCENGVFDMSPCWYQSPLYGSVPHFAGNQFRELRKSIIGLKPDLIKHKSFLDLDPITGSSLRGSKRAQVNTYIEKISTVRSVRAVKDQLFIPLFWSDESGEINDEIEKEIKTKSVYPLIITNYVTLFSLIVGSIFSFISCVFCVFCGSKKRTKKKIQTNDTNEVYLAQNYDKLISQDDAESTKTESSNSSNASKHTKTISIISKNSRDSIDSSNRNPGFILVQPIQYDKLSLDNNNNLNTTHSLALVPAYQHQLLSKIIDENSEIQMNNNNNNSQTIYPQINNNLPAVNYRPPSPKTLNESMKIISRLIELNSRNLVNDQMNLNSDSLINQQQQKQQDRSINELTVNQRKPKKLIKQFSSQESSFDFE